MRDYFKWVGQKIAIVLLIPLTLIQLLCGACGLVVLWVFDKDSYKKHWTDRLQALEEDRC